MPDPNPILLQTKLHRPRLPKDLITRTRLVEQLNHDSHLPLILVCAPAGFGKSTLVSNWLKQLTADQNAGAKFLPAAWLSLDENDSDLSHLSYATLSPPCARFSRTPVRRPWLYSRRGSTPPDDVIYATFSNELEKLPGECILVLDDYHTIQGEEVHNLLD